MNDNDSLFKGELIHFTSIDFDKDPAIQAGWIKDSEYLRGLSLQTARPLSAAEIKKKMEKIEKEQEDSHSQFIFAVRTKVDDRLVGLAELKWVEWNHGNGWISIGIGQAEDREKGYGREVLRLLLAYAFEELNLFRVSASIPAYNLPALNLFEKAGFIKEVNRRSAINRYGHSWDLYYLGLFKADWEAARQTEKKNG
jgi:RimJ/RimL family protein N-acetyltransferase